jgi:hypothetical protein
MSLYDKRLLANQIRTNDLDKASGGDNIEADCIAAGVAVDTGGPELSCQPCFSRLEGTHYSTKDGAEESRE